MKATVQVALMSGTAIAVLLVGAAIVPTAWAGGLVVDDHFMNLPFTSSTEAPLCGVPPIEIEGKHSINLRIWDSDNSGDASAGDKFTSSFSVWGALIDPVTGEKIGNLRTSDGSKANSGELPSQLIGSVQITCLGSGVEESGSLHITIDENGNIHAHF